MATPVGAIPSAVPQSCPAALRDTAPASAMSLCARIAGIIARPTQPVAPAITTLTAIFHSHLHAPLRGLYLTNMGGIFRIQPGPNGISTYEAGSRINAP